MSAYLVVDIEVTDSTTYEEYRKHVPALIERIAALARWS
jgi:uncharacterized protein (DUF1330 family)